MIGEKKLTFFYLTPVITSIHNYKLTNIDQKHECLKHWWLIESKRKKPSRPSTSDTNLLIKEPKSSFEQWHLPRRPYWNWYSNHLRVFIIDSIDTAVVRNQKSPLSISQYHYRSFSSLHRGIGWLPIDTQRVCHFLIFILLLWWQNLFNLTIFRKWSQLMITFKISTKSEQTLCIGPVISNSKHISLFVFVIHRVRELRTMPYWWYVFVFWNRFLSDEQHIFHLTIFRMKWVCDYTQSVSTIW